MQIYIAHWENSLFYLLHFALGLKLKKCFSEIKGFKILFNVKKSSICLMCSGSWFQSVGPLTLKGLAAKVGLLVLGTSSCLISCSDLRSCLLGLLILMSSSRYLGTSPWMHLNTNVMTLKLIQYCIGRQCSSSRHFDELSNLLHCSTIFAAIFQTL